MKLTPSLIPPSPDVNARSANEGPNVVAVRTCSPVLGSSLISESTRRGAERQCADFEHRAEVQRITDVRRRNRSDHRRDSARNRQVGYRCRRALNRRAGLSRRRNAEYRGPARLPTELAHAEMSPQSSTFVKLELSHCFGAQVKACRPCKQHGNDFLRLGRRHLQSVQREPLVPNTLFPHHAAGCERESAGAVTPLNRVLDVAPEVPVEIHAPGIAVESDPAVAPGWRRPAMSARH